MAWKAKILIVEDDRATGLLYRNLLQDTHDVTVVTTGTEALKAIHARVPNMVLLDQNLPDMEGIEVCRHIRANPKFAGTKVIMISGFSSVEQRLVAYRAGVDDFLGKPVDTAELQERVDTDLAMRRCRRVEISPSTAEGADHRAGVHRPNCWEFMGCGRDKTADCKAFVQQVGRYCWLVAGTMCGGEVTGTYASKMVTCMDCKFYQSIRKQK